MDDYKGISRLYQREASAHSDWVCYSAPNHPIVEYAAPLVVTSGLLSKFGATSEKLKGASIQRSILKVTGDIPYGVA